MTLNNFNTLSAKTRLDDLSVEIARMALVDGRGVSSLANEFGISRQTVYNYIEAIKNAGMEKVKLRGETYLVTPKKADSIEKSLKLP